MRNNRERWQFYNHPSKPVLSSSDVRYWKQSLKGVLKVGIEFEFNLKEQKGSCKGDNTQCPCTNIGEGCWKACTLADECFESPCIDTCARRAVSCMPDTCGKCMEYKFKCIGPSCVDFMSSCFTCTKFDKNCATCSKKYDPDRDPKHIRKIMADEFQPSNNYGKVSPSGVVGITTDGSLAGDKGAEIITIGRRVDYWEFYKMTKKIIDRSVELGAYLNERTGSHMHVLASYYENEGSNEMEKPMPQIILSNFHQLCRRYQNALTWMTIALGDPNHMTRWEKFRVSILDISPVINDMRKVVEDVHRIANGSKYGFVNYDNTRFVDGNIDRFHVEFRGADSTLCPSWYAALACMHYALVIKAVEISRYGMLKVGDEEWLTKAKRMKELILNNCGDYGGSRVADTSKLLDNRSYFIKESLDLVGQLKGILLKLGPAYDVLMKIAERPAALRLIDGDTWEDIENSLAVKMDDMDELEVKMNEIIDLKLIEDCGNIEEWAKEVQKCMIEDEEVGRKVEADVIQSFVEAKMREGEMIWSTSVGCVVSI